MSKWKLPVPINYRSTLKGRSINKTLSCLLNGQNPLLQVKREKLFVNSP